MSTTNIPQGSPRRSARLSALAALALVGCADRGAPPPPSDPVSAGARVYAMACARCHAPDGAGGGELSARLGPIPPLKSPAVAALSQADLEALIRTGRGAMPPHDKRLTPQQIAAAAAQVRALNGHAP